MLFFLVVLTISMTALWLLQSIDIECNRVAPPRQVKASRQRFLPDFSGLSSSRP